MSTGCAIAPDFSGGGVVAALHFAGWEIFHLKGSPSDPMRIYASQCGSWLGQVIQRSDDGGATWAPIVRDLPAVLSVEVQTLR